MFDQGRASRIYDYWSRCDVARLVVCVDVIDCSRRSVGRPRHSGMLTVTGDPQTARVRPAQCPPRVLRLNRACLLVVDFRSNCVRGSARRVRVVGTLCSDQYSSGGWRQLRSCVRVVRQLGQGSAPSWLSTFLTLTKPRLSEIERIACN